MTSTLREKFTDVNQINRKIIDELKSSGDKWFDDHYKNEVDHVDENAMIGQETTFITVDFDGLSGKREVLKVLTTA